MTTGRTVTSNLGAMITGYEELPEESEARGSAAGAGAAPQLNGNRI